jgi:mannose-6-phosphate isomerase-like protein (cupin superfamily)
MYKNDPNANGQLGDNMHSTTIARALAAFLVMSLQVWAQAPKEERPAQAPRDSPSAQATTGATITSGTAVDVSHEDVQKLISLAIGMPVKSADIGEAVIFVWFDHRNPTAAGRGAAQSGELHSTLTEIYYVVHGSGTLRTGGVMHDVRQNNVQTTLPGTQGVPRFPVPNFGGRIEGGVSRPMTVGDIAIIPANTAHAWETVGPDGIDVINFRIDPAKQLKGGYTHPMFVK